MPLPHYTYKGWDLFKAWPVINCKPAAAKPSEDASIRRLHDRLRSGAARNHPSLGISSLHCHLLVSFTVLPALRSPAKQSPLHCLPAHPTGLRVKKGAVDMSPSMRGRSGVAEGAGMPCVPQLSTALRSETLSSQYLCFW